VLESGQMVKREQPCIDSSTKEMTSGTEQSTVYTVSWSWTVKGREQNLGTLR